MCPLWWCWLPCPQFAVSETTWENCMNFSVSSPMVIIKRIWGTLHASQSHQRLNNTYEYQFLSLQGGIWADETLGWPGPER